MENATKALLIAAGVMIALMVLSLLLLAYNQISDYYSEKSESTQIEQLAEFNKKFENYHKENIRGSDLISLMNRVIDYNASQSYEDGTNYKRIGVTITLGNNTILKQFQYETEDITTTILTSPITNEVGTASRTNDEKLIAIASTETNLIAEARNSPLNINLTSTQLQKLSSNISNIMLNESDTSDYSKQNKIKRSTLFKNLLGVDVSTDEAKLTKIKEITSKYYQYTQFKRAYFDCTEMEYDENTGRVCEMEFELQVKDGQVVFN